VFEPGIIQGRFIGAAELAQVRALLAEHRDWSRRRISEHLACPKSARKHGKVMLGWIFSGHFGWRGGFN
jgi:hypothetical protein